MDADDEFNLEEYFEESEEEGPSREEVQKKLSEKNLIIENLESISTEAKRVVMSDISSKRLQTGVCTRNDNASVFKAVYTVCLANGIQFDPTALIKELGMKKSKVSFCMREISHTSPSKRTDIKIPLCLLSPINFISSFVERGNILEEDIERIEENVNNFMKDKSDFVKELLANINPQTILAWIVKEYYTKIKEPKLSKVPGDHKTYFTVMNLEQVNNILVKYS